MIWLLLSACTTDPATTTDPPPAVDGDLDDDGVTNALDCDDQDPRIGGEEVVYDGLDNDCNPRTPDDDLDGDGFPIDDDCDERDPGLGGPEVPYDGVDNDCDAETPDDDLDGDGIDAELDCDDLDPDRGWTEIPGDGIDNDCDPLTSDERPLEELDGPTWSTVGADGARYGGAVSSAGDVNGDGFDDVLVGAAEGGGPSAPGQAYLFLGSAVGPSSTPDWITSGAGDYASHGASVASAGDVNADGFDDVLVGAPSFIGPDNVSIGAFDLYLGSALGLSNRPSRRVTGPSYGGGGPSTSFGRALASAGDVNRDGYDDVVIGAPGYTRGQFNEGAVYVYLGGPVGLEGSWHWRYESGQESASLGTAVAAADTDGDGYDDVLAGAEWYTTPTGPDSSGAVLLFPGSTAGPADRPEWMAGGVGPLERFGGAVANAGDVNGDGFEDVVVGAYMARRKFREEGVAQVYLGSPTGLATTPTWSVAGGEVDGLLGGSVAGVGDLDRDGFDDLVVGGIGLSDLQPHEGRALLFLGSPTGDLRPGQWSAASGQEGMCGPLACPVGYGVVAGAGDVDGDGAVDLLVGAPAFRTSGDPTGLAELYLGQ